VLLPQLLLNVGVNLEQFFGQHDGSVDRNRKAAVPASDHDGDDDELGQDLEAAAE
jgi:hypothetical protein